LAVESLAPYYLIWSSRVAVAMRVDIDVRDDLRLIVRLVSSVAV
jgi:hypothetical protein